MFDDVVPVNVKTSQDGGGQAEGDVKEEKSGGGNVLWLKAGEVVHVFHEPVLGVLECLREGVEKAESQWNYHHQELDEELDDPEHDPEDPVEYVEHLGRMIEKVYSGCKVAIKQESELVVVAVECRERLWEVAG